jgi:hypothetical protein
VTDQIDDSLDNCGCCEPDPVPVPIYNRPGLPALSYRAGTYATIFRRMLARLGRETLPDGDFGGTRPLLALTTRALDDPSIALLDASAVVADVLTFYQERIANEGFLRTATERRSILELARTIGYELNPGVAASVYLAFTIEDAMGAPGLAQIPSGTKVQSVPPQGQMPQTFETSSDITAYAAWNALHPRLTYAQAVNSTTTEVYLRGTAANLKVGDRLLIDSAAQTLVSVVEVEVLSDKGQTRVAFASPPAVFPFTQDPLPAGTVDVSTQVPFDEGNIKSYILGKQWTDGDLNAFLTFNQWDQKKLLDYLRNDRMANPKSSGEVYALRTAIGFFGNNAPAFKSLPKGTTDNPVNFGQNWDTNGWQIWRDQQASNTTTNYSGADVFLERVVQGLVKDHGLSPRSWAVIENGTGNKVFVIASHVVRSLGAFAMSGKATGLTLKNPDGTTISKSSSYLVRNTTAYLQSELLPLAELPMDEALESDKTVLGLDGLVLGLKAGQAVILTGERSDAPGVTVSEVLVIKQIDHLGGFTRLTFETGRQYDYVRSTLSVNANVVPATHGESVTEILGNGNGVQSNQRFTLRKPPLTYTAAPTPSGSASTLQLRVNNLLWDEAPSLYGLGPKDQEYIVRIDDDAKATVIFGDGLKGARLPTGVNNVVATYRSGIGLDGDVDAGSLTILQSKPFGVRGVTNPLNASGGADPEKMSNARDHAPLTVRTLDRIVSVDDYQDFASAFAGIGKAQAVDLWSGEHHLVSLTIAGSDGKPIEDDKFLENFSDALDAARDPAQQVKVTSFDQLLFDLTTKVAVDRHYIVDDVFSDIQAALVDAFSFARRGFGQPVTAAEVVTVIQKVPGVVFVDLDYLFLTGTGQAYNDLLPAGIAYADDQGNIQPAQLLLINTLGVNLQKVKA